MGHSRIDDLPEPERLRLVGMVADGISWRLLANEFGLPSSTIRSWAEKNGIGRGCVSAKKRMFDALISQPHTSDFATLATAITTGNNTTDAAATRDATVGMLASNAVMNIIKRLNALANPVDSGGKMRLDSELLDGKECQVISIALDKAWNAYARINRLDDAPTEKITIKWSGTE